MNVEELSYKYIVRKLNEEDAKQVFELEKDNPLYFKYCPPNPTIESVLEDMKALPPKKTYEDKYYIGFFDKDVLVAVMDLILRYPNNDTAFIGFFMINKSMQAKGIGSSIIEDCVKCIKQNGFTHVRLGYMKPNEQSHHFWLKNGFVHTGIETNNGQGIVVILEKEI